MQRRLCFRSGLLGWVVLSAGLLAQTTETLSGKTATPSTRLLLPLYEVDTVDPSGTTTLFAVRNEREVSVQIAIRYFRSDAPQAPQRSELVTLQAKEVRPVNIRFVPDLEVDASGMARGYVVIEAVTPGALIQGDYYRLTPGEDFASGFRLLNISPTSPHNEICNRFSMRFLNGGGFDSGTTFVVWLDLDEAPTPLDPVFVVAAYDEPGDLLLTRELFSEQVAFEVSASQLLEPSVVEDFGALEFQFANGTLGHISAVMSAGGRYSVGLEASCGDP